MHEGHRVGMIRQANDQDRRRTTGMTKAVLPRRARSLAVIGMVIAVGVLLAGCYVAPVGPGPGWCYYHPHRC
jgi:hypothetical protein